MCLVITFVAVAVAIAAAAAVAAAHRKIEVPSLVGIHH